MIRDGSAGPVFAVRKNSTDTMGLACHVAFGPKPMRTAFTLCELCSESSRVSYQLALRVNVFFASGFGFASAPYCLGNASPKLLERSVKGPPRAENGMLMKE